MAAVAATAGVLLLAGGATPAYAVSTNDDGTVTVEINSLSDAAGLESKLREAGIHAVVQYLPPGKTCKQPWFTPVAYEHGPGHVPATSGVEHTSDVFNRFTIGTHHPTAATLVITNQAAPDADAGSAGSVESISIAWAMGEVKQCMVVDAP